MQFPDFALNLIERIYADDMESQDYYLNLLGQAREIPLDYLKSLGAFFVPNNDYIKYYGGNDSLNPDFDLYTYGQCLWTHFLVIPVKNLSGKICGFVGWDANNSLKKAEGIATDLSTYRVSNKRVFDKNHYFLADVKVLEENYHNGVLFVVDGVFDSLSLNCRGIPAISLLGSYPSALHYYFLHWFSHIYVITDNDKAGCDLYRWIHRAIPRTRRITQTGCKDIDAFLKQYPGIAERELFEILRNPLNRDYEIGRKGTPRLRSMWLGGKE